jgi:hypothetical protein
MKNKTQRKPTAGKFSLLGQLCNLIPAHLAPKLARDTGVIKRSRTFTPWSHVVGLLYAQLTHALGLNDVCDALRLHSGPLSAGRGATPPSKNALSTANRERAAQMAQDLFYAVLGHLEKLHPGFGRDHPPAFCLPLQAGDSSGGCHDHPVGRPLLGLGQTPPPQGRRQARECAFDVGRKLGKARFYAVGSGLIEGGIWRRLFGLGFGGLGRRGNGQNLLNGVPEFDAVQSQIFSACHAHTKAQVKTNC